MADKRPSEILATKKQPNDLPTITELRESQKQGSEGKGTASKTYNEVQAMNNMGTGVPVEEE